MLVAQNQALKQGQVTQTVYVSSVVTTVRVWLVTHTNLNLDLMPNGEVPAS